MQNISAIVFTSNTGFTAHLASLLGEAARLPFYPLESARRALAPGTPVIYMGWLCAGSLKGYKAAAKRFDIRAACAVGMGEPGLNSMAELSGRMAMGDLPLFYLQGGYDPKQLTGIYKMMMAFAVKAMGGKSGSQGRSMADVAQTGADWVTPEQLGPVLDWMGLLS